MIDNAHIKTMVDEAGDVWIKLDPFVQGLYKSSAVIGTSKTGNDIARFTVMTVFNEIAVALEGVKKESKQ